MTPASLRAEVARIARECDVPEEAVWATPLVMVCVMWRVMGWRRVS